jgi:hypothetical protein
MENPTAQTIIEMLELNDVPFCKQRVPSGRERDLENAGQFFWTLTFFLVRFQGFWALVKQGRFGGNDTVACARCL